MSGKPENVRDNRKKDRIGITPKRLKAFIHAGLRCPRARAQKTRKNKKKPTKNPLPKPGLWATSTLLACQGTGTPTLRGGSFPQIVAPRGGELAPNTGLQPAPRALLDVGRAAPRPPCGCAPLRGLNGHAGTPLWLGNERVGAGMRRNGHRKPWEPFCGLRGTSGQGWGEKTRCRPF